MLPKELKTKFMTNLTSRLNKREKVLFIILSVSLLLYLYYDQVYTRQMQEVKSLSAELEARQAMLNDYLARGYDDIAGLNEQKEETRAKIENLHVRVPDHLGEAAILVDIHYLVRENNLYAETLSFENFQEEEGFGRLPVSLTAEGAQIDVYRFIDQLENFYRKIRVASVEFIPAGGNWVTCHITAEFYVLGTPGKEPSSYPFTQGEYGTVPAHNVFKPPFGGESGAGDKYSDRFGGRYPVMSGWINNVEGNGSDGAINQTGEPGVYPGNPAMPFTK